MREQHRHSAEDLLQVGFRYAHALTHHPQDAEDLVQTAWLKLHQQHGAVTGKALLFTTIRHLYIDQYRRGKTVPFEPLSADIERSLVAPEVDNGTLPADLHRMLSQLRDTEREALFLNAVEGYSASEIACMTGKSRGTILSLMQRGRQKLVALFKAEERSA